MDSLAQLRLSGHGAVQMAKILNDGSQYFGVLFLNGQGHLDEAQRRLVIILAVFSDSPICVDREAFSYEIS